MTKASPSFVVMRQLAMRFRRILRGEDPDKLNYWLHDAKHSGVHSMQQFARTLSRDIEAVRNAIAEHWSSGQAEGQINRLKTLKRAMYGRAGIEPQRAECFHSNPPCVRKVTATPIKRILTPTLKKWGKTRRRAGPTRPSRPIIS